MIKNTKCVAEGRKQFGFTYSLLLTLPIPRNGCIGFWIGCFSRKYFFRSRTATWMNYYPTVSSTLLKEFLMVYFCHLCFSNNSNRNDEYFCSINWWKHFRVILTDQKAMSVSLCDSSLRLLISLKNTDIWQYKLEERKVNGSGKKKIW